MPASLKFDFYQVETPDGSQPLDVLLNGIVQEFADDDSRTQDIRGFPVRLQKTCSVARLGLIGDIIRIRFNDLPVKAKTSGQTSALDLADDEGLGQETIFLYSSDLRTLAIHKNRSGVSASSLIKYVSMACGIDSPFFLNPILRRSAMKRLSKMSAIRKFEIRVAGTENLAGIVERNSSISRIVSLGDILDSPTVHVELSMGYQRGSLNMRSALDVARSALRLKPTKDGSGVTTLRVSGETGDDGMDVLDLLESRLSCEVPVDVNGRSISYAQRLAAIKTAWANCLDEIRELSLP